MHRAAAPNMEYKRCSSCIPGLGALTGKNQQRRQRPYSWILPQLLIDIGVRGKALIWIADFLRGRRIKVRFNGAFSKDRRRWAGVPQGSVLSLLLFLLYINDIHPYLTEDTKVACYADDIAIWHTSSSIEKSEKMLNTSMRGVEKWAMELKMTINPIKTNLCVFSTDRKNRHKFNPKISINNQIIDKIRNPKYLGVILDEELRFTEHIISTSNRATRKLNILRRLCGTNWGAKPKTLRTTYTTLIRPIMEYATPVWAPSSSSLKGRLDSVQAKAAKIITGAVSSTNNEKIQRECGLDLLKSRRQLKTIKFTNSLKSKKTEHISHRTYLNWTQKEVIKRSSTLQKDYPYTDGSSDLTLSNGGAGINIILQDGTHIKIKEGAGKISSNFTCELTAIWKALDVCLNQPFLHQTEGIIIYSDSRSSLEAIQKGNTRITQKIHSLLTQLETLEKNCILQWIPAHVGIEGNEMADELAKEARKLSQRKEQMSVFDADALAKYKIIKHKVIRPI
ncbi:hypothetical protein LAZ67_22000283 [Cordylochernes scorpioides]|uniref:Reverse transcriptase n=1 Tax=Cordylochernes scorpioides TaxID=51811 RepID=A0ABY6LN45_9ARAC|nr:hypothetical protein LAZ67_22000283 [Cordylochernes scorpioides]